MAGHLVIAHAFRWLMRASVAAIATATFATLVSILWQADKGLGFGDEGTYLQAAAYPEEIRENVSIIFVYTGALFEAAGQSVSAFRALGVFCLLASALVLAAGFTRMMARENAAQSLSPTLTYLFVTIGTLLHYQWSYLTPSYYTFTAFAVNLVCGFTLLAAACKSPNSSQVAAFLLGLTLCATLFAKFTTAIPLGVLCAFVLSAVPSSISRGRLLLMTSLGAGFWLAFFFVVIQNPFVAYANFAKGWELYQTLGYHRPSDKITAYPIELWVLTLTGAYAFRYPLLFVAIGSVAVLLTAKARGRNQGALGTVRLLVVLATIGFSLVSAFNSGANVVVADRLITRPVDGLTRPYLAIEISFLLLSSAILFASRIPFKPNRGSLSLALIFLFLLAAPVAGGLGTSNPLYNVIQFYAAPWFCVILLLLSQISGTYASRVAVHAVSLILAIHTASNVIQGGLFVPAQIKPRNLLDQTLPIEVGVAQSVLYVDAETKHIVDTLATAAEQSGYTRGDDIIGFNTIAGLVFALGAKSPGHPVFPCCRALWDDYTEMAFQFSNRERLQRSLLLLDVAAPSDAAVAKILATQGMNFPSDYEMIKSVFGLGREFRLYRPTP